jgi:transposase InsO family protein
MTSYNRTNRLRYGGTASPGGRGQGKLTRRTLAAVYRDGQALHMGLQRYFYNSHRPHQALAYQTPAAVYRANLIHPRLTESVPPWGV